MKRTLFFVGCLIWTVQSKLDNSYESIESNFIQNPPPQRTTAGIREKDWVKVPNPPPSVINTRLGARIELTCEALGSPIPDIHWYRGDLPVNQIRKPSPSVTMERNGLAKVKSRLIIDCVGRHHEGFYTCVAEAGSKQLRTSPTVVIVAGHGDLEQCNFSPAVNKKPVITSWALTAMETMGVDVRLPCQAEGYPKPHVYWLDPHNNMINSLRHQVAENGDLIISRLTWADMGEYTCVAENQEGHDAVTTFIYPVLNDMK